jgi:hypothetical protein
VAAATDAIVRAALAPKSSKPQRSFARWGAIGAATLAIAPLAGACEKSTSPPPPDPLPVPTLVSGPPDAETTETTEPRYVQPNDPVPTPMTSERPATLIVDAGALDAGSRKRDAAVKPPPPPPPPDPLPPPTLRPPPPDPLPRPHTK